MRKTTRSNLVRLLRSKILVNSTVASGIVDRCHDVGFPIHDAVLEVEQFDEEDATGWCLLSKGGNVFMSIALRKGELGRWLASDEGRARIEADNAERTAEALLRRTASVNTVRLSTTWPGTAEVVLDDGDVLPLVPLVEETAQDVLDMNAEYEGRLVTMRIVPASAVFDDFARSLPQDQPCVDWIMMARAA